MKYSFIGDCHGKIETLLPLIERRCQDSDLVLQLGDMGLGFRGVSLPHLKRFGFIRGNHDSPSMCQLHENYAGDFGPWHDLFVFGGGYSIDWQWRTPGISWWPDEELSKEQGEKALKAYLETKPRVVASHEAPEKVGEALLLDGGFRPEKWGSTGSRTAKLLQSAFDAHKPEFWFFGHYHRDWQTEIDGCKFLCLNELSLQHLIFDEKQNHFYL